MPSIKMDAYTMDRRQLLKLTGTMGVGASFMTPAELFAAGMCEKIIVENGEIDAEAAGLTLQFWVDGLHFGARTDVKSRANVTLFMDQTQSATAHVESVVLMNEAKQTMGARYFDSSMKLSSGHVPYVRFENVELDATKKYHCVYTVRTGSNVKLYSATIDKPQVSRLNTTWLPNKMRADFGKFLAGDAVNDTPGLITTQYQFYTENGLSSHTARGRLIDMSSNGDFTINIDFMHGDVPPTDPTKASTHYMRYFIVMDPVGRLCGFAKRRYNSAADKDASTNNALGDNTWNVTRITPQQMQDFSIPKLQVANIADCPYIQFYTEDSFDAIARNMIRLR